MNTLILGAIFLVALLAIGGAVWLALGERQGNGSAPAPAAPTPASQQSQAPVTSTSDGRASTERRAAATTAPPVEAGDLALAPAQPATSGEQGFSALNGQFNELATELRALHREAQDIERRLSVLTEMVSRIEREYGEVGLE